MFLNYLSELLSLRLTLFLIFILTQVAVNTDPAHYKLKPLSIKGLHQDIANMELSKGLSSIYLTC